MYDKTFPIQDSQILRAAKKHQTPFYIYSLDALEQRAQELLDLQLPFGCTVRYAVKANPHPQIIKIFLESGLHFDASSSYEATELLGQGVQGQKISLSSQQPAHNIDELLSAGVRYVATSLHQLRLFAKSAPAEATLGLRVNAAVGSGHNKRNTTAGTGASFGLWHEYLNDALNIARQNNLIIDRLHTHIGSGADPAVWSLAIDASLKIAEKMPDVTILDMGGGYKVSRAANEPESDMHQIASVFSKKLTEFAKKTGRQLQLEIEPGTWLVAHSANLITRIGDIVDTGSEGYTFLRTNTGMNDFLRPAMYGAQHQIRLLGNTAEETKKPYVIVGHNCESSDILTPAPGDPESIAERILPKAKIGDLLAISDAGAYCASMHAKGYNSFPDANEIFV